MPIAPPVACNYPGCPNVVPSAERAWYCAEHRNETKNDFDKYRAETDPVRKFELSPEWRNCSLAFRSRNPACQLLLSNGQQCGHTPKAVHHIVSTRELYKTYPADWQRRAMDDHNLVSLCAKHHYKDDANAPDTRRYSPTKLLTGEMFQPPTESAPVGRKKKKGSIDWDAPFSIPDTA